MKSNVMGSRKKIIFTKHACVHMAVFDMSNRQESLRISYT